MEREILLSLRGRKGEFLCYNVFVSRRVDVKHSFRSCDEKLYDDVVLSIVKIIMIE